MKLRLAFLLLASALGLRAADGLPVFNAVLTMGRESQFVLVDASGRTSGFLKLGQSFAGCTLKAYEAKTGVLEVERDGKPVRLTLVAEAAVKHADAAPARATLADATAVLDAMNFEQMMEKTMAGVRKQQVAMVDRMMGQMLPPGADRDAVMDLQKRMIEEIMSAMNYAEMKGDMAKVYSDVFTKDQLAALGTFYQSPAGQAMSEKQPEITEKLNALMMPRMMAAIPKVQQMAKDFALEQKLRRDAAAKAPAPTPKQ
ncbi:MAG: DUF2059 domain-containing protein [Opitutaceae bacterium]|nr:DUF2059 domain-containing protein [Opitutaceae bacterium]